MSDKSFKQPSVMSTQKRFAQVPKSQTPRSKFDRSHALKTTFDAGKLVPVFCDEVIPGDTFSLSTTSFARLATPLKPIMDNIYLDMQFFFVPYRLVWDNWQAFMGERRNPDDDPSIYTIPTFSNTAGAFISTGSIFDYFGLPTGIDITEGEVSCLPLRAYNLIYNEWYRDQNLQDRVPENTDDGPDSVFDYQLKSRGKRHDYFTSCLPWPQKGDPVTVPIGDEAPVIGLGVQTTQPKNINTGIFTFADGTTQDASIDGMISTGVLKVDGASAPYTPDIYADLASATSISINELRTAFQIQKLLERDARGGTRYIEIILNHFNVQSPDGRLQRPEFLGGGSTRVNINPVAATATDDTIPQGNLAATGTSIGNAGFKKSFTEHGIIIGICSARADLTYQQGLDRMWSRKTRYDFPWPAFAHLGEQPVYNKEIYATGTSTDDDVFGYQERYAEFRYKPSRITGLFRSTATSSLDPWHLSQEFTTLPTLGDTFITENPPLDRVIAVPAEPHFLADFWFKLYCDRALPVYSVPGFIDHF